MFPPSKEVDVNSVILKKYGASLSLRQYTPKNRIIDLSNYVGGEQHTTHLMKVVMGIYMVYVY